MLGLSCSQGFDIWLGLNFKVDWQLSQTISSMGFPFFQNGDQTKIVCNHDNLFSLSHSLYIVIRHPIESRDVERIKSWWARSSGRNVEGEEVDQELAGCERVIMNIIVSITIAINS